MAAAGACEELLKPSVDDFLSVDVYDLYNMMQNDGTVRVIDARSPDAPHSNVRIQESVRVPPACKETTKAMMKTATNERRLSVPGRHVYWVLYDSSVEKHRNSEWVASLACCLKRQMTSIEVAILANGLDSFFDLFPFLCEKVEPQEEGSAKPITRLFSYPNIIIHDFLFLGNINHARSLHILKALRITHVIDCANIPGETFESSGIQYLQIQLPDEEESNLQEHFDSAFDFITKAATGADSRVLVHCRAGVSRSASLVIWYVMKQKNLGLYEAWEFVRTRRECICPNLGFRRQLYDAEIALRGKSKSQEDLLKQFGVFEKSAWKG